MPKFRCTVAIPTRELFHGEIEYAQIPGSEGDLGVMAGHEMFVCTNRSGVLTLTLDEAGKDKRYFVTYGGFAQVLDNNLSVLARMGKDVDSIDVEELTAKAAKLREAIAQLEGKGYDQSTALLETHRTKLEWYDLQLKAVGAVK